MKRYCKHKIIFIRFILQTAVYWGSQLFDTKRKHYDYNVIFLDFNEKYPGILNDAE